MIDQDLLGAISPPGHTSMKQHIDALRTCTNDDNVHLTPTGYEHVATAILTELRTLRTSKVVVNANLSCTRDWKGFVSTSGVGATVRHTFLKSGHLHKAKANRNHLMPNFLR